MALTERGRVLSWGLNLFGQLGHNNKQNSNKPLIVPLSNKIAIKKISCGSNHSLLLSKNGDIYWFGFNGLECKIAPEMVTINSNKWIDIASNYNYDICIAQTKDWVYVWGACLGVQEKNVIISQELKQTQFKTFEQFYNNFFGINYRPNEKLIDYGIKIQLTENAKYEQEFQYIQDLGEGSLRQSS
jgi:alpha-tubulin suppressor-like RCC1 family protein